MNKLEEKIKKSLISSTSFDIHIIAQTKEILKKKISILFNIIDNCKKNMKIHNGYLYMNKIWKVKDNHYNCSWRITFKDKCNKFILY